MVTSDSGPEQSGARPKRRWALWIVATVVGLIVIYIAVGVAYDLIQHRLDSASTQGADTAAVMFMDEIAAGCTSAAYAHTSAAFKSEVTGEQFADKLQTMRAQKLLPAAPGDYNYVTGYTSGTSDWHFRVFPGKLQSGETTRNHFTVVVSSEGRYYRISELR